MLTTKSKTDGLFKECSCRLCGGEVLNRFNLMILLKYDVQYYECKKCHSLQTENPYWLNETYNQNLSNLDTGAAQRNLHNLAACYGISKLFNIKNILDIGGGDGLLCRLLRDYGFNCFVKDKYAKPIYAQGFTEPNFDQPDLITAFEVLEHYSNPVVDLEEIFRFNPNFVLISTAVYIDQKQDWWYFAKEGGQHVFFYSKEGLDLIAKKYDYQLIMSGGFILLAKQEALTPMKIALAKMLLKGRICRLIKAIVVLLPTPAMWVDQASFQKNT